MPVQAGEPGRDRAHQRTRRDRLSLAIGGTGSRRPTGRTRDKSFHAVASSGVLSGLRGGMVFGPPGQERLGYLQVLAVKRVLVYVQVESC